MIQDDELDWDDDAVPEAEAKQPGTAFGGPLPKNRRRSVYRKYRRRRTSAAYVLAALEHSAQEYLSQGGLLRKRKEAEALLDALTKFRDETGLLPPEPTDMDMSHLDNLFGGDISE